MRIVTGRRLLAVVRGVDAEKVRRRDVWETRRLRLVEQRMYEHLGGCVRDGDGFLNLYRAPPYLTELSEALALLDRALPGWLWSVSRTQPCEASEGLPFHAECSTIVGTDGGARTESAQAGGRTAPLAVVTALLRAWIVTAVHEAERGGDDPSLPGT